MFSLKLAFAIAVAVTAARAGPTVNDDNCQNFIGDCFQNGCSGVFANPSDTIGTCTAGTFNGCPCEKCGSGRGFVGGCGDNGCAGLEGICSAGQFQGCPCQ
ncbi:hypothetical protein F4820DRAFT_454519 [Hypoxylon rubiginosum]|uniref:Uncharacterized protein n=1 Tax=Hypoxylon rubiginosum TaxID=110542 RepID=A0ACB9YHC7_9PEZI|nr:hypothetical protein F4820DRAFT_454519 [Hypoxylon rubiginosum]